MFTKEAIELLSQAQAITAANASMPAKQIALPDHYALHSTEHLSDSRTRQRGRMTTTAVPDFAAYIGRNQQLGATVFINPKTMAAKAVLNLGHTVTPGHADDTATLSLEPTAAFTAAREVATGNPKGQSEIAEFLEDWPDLIKCYHGGDELTPPKAVAAIRRITIEAIRKSENAEGQLSAERSAFEQVSATSGADKLPTHIYFTCTPYPGLEARTFVMRLALRTGGDKPAITLRIVKAEAHHEEMLREFQELVTAAISGEVPVHIGTYEPAA